MEPQARVPRVQGDEVELVPASQAALADTGPGADGRGGSSQCAMVDGLHVRHAVSRPSLSHAEHPRRGCPRGSGHRHRHLDPRRPRGAYPGSAGSVTRQARRDPGRQRPRIPLGGVRRLVPGPGDPAQLHPAWQAESKRLHRTLQSDLSARGARCLRVRIASPGPRDHVSVDRRIQRGTWLITWMGTEPWASPRLAQHSGDRRRAT